MAGSCPLVERIEVLDQVRQLAVLRHARAFVTHAGMGSTVEGIYLRVPLIAVPQMAEQRANADRIVGLGLGLALDPEHVDADALWTAVIAAADDARVGDRLAQMRVEMDEAGCATTATDVTERVLDKRRAVFA